LAVGEALETLEAYNNKIAALADSKVSVESASDDPTAHNAGDARG
jgi:hypothetical protein